MKKYNFLVLAALLLLILPLSNCYFYKTIEESTDVYSLMDSTRVTKNEVFLENSYSDAIYRVDDFAINDSTFSGFAYFTLAVHTNTEKSFHRRKKKEEKYNIQPLRAMHIVLKSDSMIQEGYFEAAISSISEIKIHEKAKGKSTAASTAFILVGAGIAVGLGFLITSMAMAGMF